MTSLDLVDLYQQICARVGAYNTEILIERMFEIRAEILKRFASQENELSAHRADYSGKTLQLASHQQTLHSQAQEIERLRGALRRIKQLAGEIIIPASSTTSPLGRATFIIDEVNAALTKAVLREGGGT